MRAVRHMAEPKPVRSRHGLRTTDMGSSLGARKSPGIIQQVIENTIFILVRCGAVERTRDACWLAHDLIRKPVPTFRDHAL
jgi:hypothetical protein